MCLHASEDKIFKEQEDYNIYPWWSSTVIKVEDFQLIVNFENVWILFGIDMQNKYPHTSLICQLFLFVFPPLFAANVFILKGNFTLTGKTWDFQEITFSNFDGLQLKITCYYHEILHQPN